jgi:hypothetical protein
MLPLLIGAGAGLLKSELIDRPQADRQRKLAATTAALSPWTGMTPEMPQEANPLGSMLQGGLAGAQIGQAMGASPAAAAAPAAATPDAAGGVTQASQDYLKGGADYGASQMAAKPNTFMGRPNTMQGSLRSWFNMA